MKIVLLIDSLGFGGAQRQIVNLAIELKKGGHDIHFIRYRNDDFFLPLLSSNDIKPINIEEKNLCLRALKIRKTIRSISPDTVISFLDSPNFYACLATIGKHHWKLINSERLANESSFINRKTKIVKGVQAKYADIIVCNSKCAENLWRKYYPKYETKFNTIYNVMEISDYPAVTQDDGKCRILIAARYEPVKNITGLLRAVDSLTAEEKSKLELHWYGKENLIVNAVSEYENALKFIKDNHLESCVFLHPATDKIYQFISETDFVGLFSLMEGFPNSVIEGMYLNKPIIMSKVSDYKVLVDESNGYLCEPKDNNDIVDALRDAINTSPEDRKKMGLVSHEKICRLCSRDVVMNQWNDLIN